MDCKSVFASKTVWLNVIAAVIAIVQGFQGQPWINPEWQALILAVLNVIVRFLTSQPVSLSGTGCRPAGPLLVLALTGALLLSACSTLPQRAAQVASVAVQAQGAVRGLVDVALAAPLDDRTRQQIGAYGQWAQLATDAVAGVSTALSSHQAVTQAAGTVQAINHLVQAAPVGDDLKHSVGGWAQWAMIAIRAAAAFVPLVL